MNHLTQYPPPYRPTEPSKAGAGWIIVFCILWTIFAPVPGPIDDLIVWAFGAYAAIRDRPS